MEALRDQRGLPWLEDFLHDVRYGVRTVRRSPMVASVIVLSLALGIGANSALFSLIDATLLRELSVDAPEELVQLRWRSHSWFPDMSRFAGSGSISTYRRSPTFSNAAFDALRAGAPTLAEIFAFSRMMPVTAAIDRQGDSATVQLVSGTYFSGLRGTPSLGRPLTMSDDSAASPPAAVISDRYWRRRFDADPRAVGTAASLNGLAVTIVGVAPAGFRGAAAAGSPIPDFWIPLAFAKSFGPRHLEPAFWWLSIAGRMRPDVTMEQVRDSLDGTFRTAVSATEATLADDPPRLQVFSARRGAEDEGPGDELEHAVILGAIFGGLLLVVCLNVANLLLSRSAARRTEIAVRLSLGAGRGRLIRQLLAESLTLSIAAGALGVVFAYGGRGLFAASTLVPGDLDLRIDLGVVGVTLLISIAAGILFGLVPALRAARAHPDRLSLNVGLPARSPSRLNRSLLVTQVALSVVLLVGAGLLLRTLWSWNDMETGFDTRNLLVFQVSPSTLGYRDVDVAALRDRLVTRIRAVPGVAAVTTSGSFWKERFNRFLLDGVARRHEAPHWLSVRHDFFGTLGLPLLAGRGFLPEENDKAGPPGVAVVDETFARRFFDGAQAIGHRVAFEVGGPEVEIVGVVGNMRLPGTRPEDVKPRIYLPEHTRPPDFDPDWAERQARYPQPVEISFEVRTATDPMSVLPAIRAAVDAIDAELPVLHPKTVSQGMWEKLSPTRVVSFIWLAFGSVALVLTAIGLYGLVAYSVVQRTREIGIRTALGARRFQIVRLVTSHTVRLVAIGMIVGVALSLARSTHPGLHLRRHALRSVDDSLRRPDHWHRDEPRRVSAGAESVAPGSDRRAAVGIGFIVTRKGGGGARIAPVPERVARVTPDQPISFGVAASDRAIASASRFQLAVSSPSRLRPAGVSR